MGSFNTHGKETDYLRVGLLPVDTTQRLFVILRFERTQRAVVDPIREGDP